MRKYVLNRLFWLAVTVLCVAVLIFTVMHFTPGDPAHIILGEGLPEADYAAMRERLGLNDPFFTQLFRFLYNAITKFDFGDSWTYGVPVVEELGRRLPRTVLLGLFGVILNTFVGIPIGISAALHRNSWQDQGVLILSMAFVSIPGFWLAIQMVVLFTKELQWLPGFGIGTWKHWVMPIMATSFTGIANMARQTRSAVLETCRADFVTTARAKGLAERVVTYKHLLPNAMIPIMGMLGGQFSRLIAGSAIIETVFSFPGVGTYMLTGLSNRDYPITMTCVLMLATFSSIMHLVVDLSYAWLDPRIKAQYEHYGERRATK